MSDFYGPWEGDGTDGIDTGTRQRTIDLISRGNVPSHSQLRRLKKRIRGIILKPNYKHGHHASSRKKKITSPG
jgi:hypothetical protein